ncbi:MAG: nuclease-related domain-containing protein [Bacillota bacterium]
MCTNGESFIQIDTLILTRNFILILEIKNIAGSLEFRTEFEQFSRTLNGEVTGFPNPISQANRYKIHLTQWPQKKRLPIIPIEFLVVFTNSSSLISTSNQFMKTIDRAIRIENLVAKFLTIQHKYSNSNSILEVKNLKRLPTSLGKSMLHILNLTNSMKESYAVLGVPVARDSIWYVT